jgi:putative ABC transport system permease protein
MRAARYQLAESLSVLRTHRLRSFLTIFGIMWGIAAFLFAGAVLEGFQASQRLRFEAVGKDLLVVDGGRTSRAAFGHVAGREINLGVADIKAVARSKYVKSLSPELARHNLAISGPRSRTTVPVFGIWPVYQQMRFIDTGTGRLLNTFDDDQGRRICVIGNDLSAQLLGDKPLLPAPITIDRVQYTVVGIARKKPAGAVMNGNDNTKIFVPFRSMERDFPLTSKEAGTGASLVIQPVTADVHERLLDDVRQLLGVRHGFDPADIEALNVMDTVQTVRNLNSVFAGLARFSDISSLMTVAMGAIGLTNILLISVRERTLEIGVRRSVGARRWHIFTQFLAEGMVLSSLGGLFGLLAGAGLAFGLGLLPIPGFTTPVVRLTAAFMACLVIVAAGLTASAYPAWKALRINPVEALRYG